MPSASSSIAVQFVPLCGATSPISALAFRTSVDALAAAAAGATVDRAAAPRTGDAAGRCKHTH